MKSFLKLQSVEEVLAHLRTFPPLPPEDVPLEEALSRFTAAPLAAPHDLPGFDRSTVDGFAVRARDVFGAQEASPALLDIAGDCRMGEAAGLTLEEGRTARILTGGMLPAGADAVVMVEYSRPAGGRPRSGRSERQDIDAKNARPPESRRPRRILSRSGYSALV